MAQIMASSTWLATAVVLLMAEMCAAQPPEMPKPTKEHELLNQFAGEWDLKIEMIPAPGQEPIKCEATESAKMVGGFWLVSRGEGNVMNTPMTNLLTIGYDPKTKKYVGTFVCSADSTLWKYEGAMDASGKALTLETTGPSPLDPTKNAKYRETLELKDKDHKVFTSLMQGDDGKWVKFVTMDYRRKK